MKKEEVEGEKKEREGVKEAENVGERKRRGGIQKEKKTEKERGRNLRYPLSILPLLCLNSCVLTLFSKGAKLSCGEVFSGVGNLGVGSRRCRTCLVLEKM